MWSKAASWEGPPQNPPLPTFEIRDTKQRRTTQDVSIYNRDHRLALRRTEQQPITPTVKFFPHGQRWQVRGQFYPWIFFLFSFSLTYNRHWGIYNQTIFFYKSHYFCLFLFFCYENPVSDLPTSSIELAQPDNNSQWPKNLNVNFDSTNTGPKTPSSIQTEETSTPALPAGIGESKHHRPDAQPSAFEVPGKPFLVFTDSLSLTELTNNTDSRATRVNQGNRSKSSRLTHTFPWNSLYQHTLADTTMRPEGIASPQSRREVEGGSAAASRTACGIGSGMGGQGPLRMEEGPVDRSIDLEARGTHLPDKLDRSGQVGKSVNHQRGCGTMKPTSLSPQLFHEEALAANSRRQSPSSPPTETRWTVPVRETSVWRDGIDLKQLGNQHGSSQVDCQRENEKIVSSFKAIFTDSILSPFTNKLGYSLSHISTRCLDFFSILEVLEVKVKSGKREREEN